LLTSHGVVLMLKSGGPHRRECHLDCPTCNCLQTREAFLSEYLFGWRDPKQPEKKTSLYQWLLSGFRWAFPP